MAKQAKPVTSRQLMKLARKERGNICRVLYNLEKAKTVEIIETAPCPITGRRVRWYQLVQNYESETKA